MMNMACYSKFPFQPGPRKGLLLSVPDCVPGPSASGMWSRSPVPADHSRPEGLKALLWKWPHPQVALSPACRELGQPLWLQSP